MDKKEQRAGIVVVVEMDGEPVALLNRRGKLNPEKIGTEKLGRETWAGGCQVTAHGRALARESDPLETMLREVTEERGFEWGSIITAAAAQHLVYAANMDENDKRVITTYGVFINNKALSLLEYMPRTLEGHKRRLRVRKNALRNELISTVAEFVALEESFGQTLDPLPLSRIDQLRHHDPQFKMIGVTDLEIISMFPDEAVAVKAALEKAGTLYGKTAQ